MDANGLRFWMLSTADHWHYLGDPVETEYDADCQTLQLASKRNLPPWSTTDPSGETLESEAVTRLEKVPQTQDQFGTRAYWDSDDKAVKASGAFPNPIDILIPAEAPTDLTIGYDGILYLAFANLVLLQDRRDRWLPESVSLPGFEPWRLAANPEGGVWVLDRTNRQLAKVQGVPFPRRPYGEFAPDIARPCQENPNPPRLTIFPKAIIPPDEKPIALHCNPAGRLVLLTWKTHGTAHLRTLTDRGIFTPPVTLTGCRFPYSLRWVGSDLVAVLVPHLSTEAPVYSVSQLASGKPEPTMQVQPVGDFYPLRNPDAAPFIQTITQPLHYLSSSETVPLYPLSLPSYATQGTAENKLFLDSGTPQTEWHRLYLEAVIPAKCGIQIYLAATDTPARPADDSPDWFEHRFGDRFPSDGKIPQAAWVSQPSEIAFHPGLLSRTPEKNRSGLFTVLIQRSDRRVHTLQGRYLWVKAVLSGDGRTTPELAALRAYGSRFSYVREYLPTLYHETTLGSEKDDVSPATPADFLERLIANFEGILTPIEDRIAQSYLLTDPRTTPDDAIDWLANWIGITFDSAYSNHQRRKLIAAAPELYRQRGTLNGLKQLLDIVTNGAVSGGEIVVLENFRLRRTFATILGADLADETDPLTAGIAVSGNSFVGDTLFLGDEDKKEFLAVFGADLPTSTTEQKAIAAFLDRLAYRVTVLVHNQIEPQNLGLIRRIVDQETPAHVLTTVATATYPFLVSIASLIGVDTYLANKPKPKPVRLNRSHLGERDLLLRPASLDPRLDSGAEPSYVLPRPIAQAEAPPEVPLNAPILLDATNSLPPPKGAITRYIWTRVAPQPPTPP